MDYETFWDSIDAPTQTVDHSYTSVIGSNGRVGSYAYYTSAVEGFEVPTEHRLALYRGEDADVKSILSLLKLAESYLDRVMHHPTVEHERAR